MATSVYIESSIVSYLTARPSRDLVIASRQAFTADWWLNSANQWGHEPMGSGFAILHFLDFKT